MAEEKKKRKTKTSSAVKNRYNKKTYKSINVSLKKELVAEWENVIKKDNLSKAEFIRRAINQYLENKQSK